jgi:lipopolysaccharide/colanic/teichoic acid biosynthesis glycosyltransferase
MNALYLPIKRALDIILGGLGVLALALLYVPLAVAIKLDSPGPAIFTQRRVGQGGRLFFVYKFRTMYVNAARYEVKPLTNDDERITRVGRFLRRTSLDEWPQFLNVVKGEMSMVGPRPEQPFLVEWYQPWQRRRLDVKPGLTGWWQVNGRPQPMAEHIEYDIYYVEHQSLRLDLLILVRTIGAMIGGEGAI